MTILYITQNGVTDHIGRSQIAPYVIGLARMGYRIHVLSTEKTGHDALIDEYSALFAAAGVDWSRVRYRNRPQLIGQAWTQWKTKRMARRIISERAVKVVHCRNHLPALLGASLCDGAATRFIFDFRDFYADGGLQTRPFKFVYRRLKRLEGPLVRAAAKVVCLTERATGILANWYLGGLEVAGSRFQVIPCCADFSLFDPASVTDQQRERARAKTGVGPDDMVLLYLGSLGPDYLLPQMVRLFAQLLAIRPNAVFLFVCNNGKELAEREFIAQGLDPTRIRHASADRCEVPALISLATMSVVFIRADVSKAGCSPTKLAELFACNVPVIANTGVGDMDAIISLEKNGSVIVRDFEDATLRDAILSVLGAVESGIPIRENSRAAFSLEAGVAKYAQVYDEMLGTSLASQGNVTC
jgi:glycosyltransferase involved in cell wall biosynthesis